MPKKVKSNTVNIGLVQMSCDQKPETNLRKAIARIEEAAKKGAQIVCLQELSAHFTSSNVIRTVRCAAAKPVGQRRELPTSLIVPEPKTRPKPIVPLVHSECLLLSLDSGIGFHAGRFFVTICNRNEDP